MNKLLKLYLLAIAAILVLESNSFAESCPISHCANIDPQVKATCEANGWKEGHPQWVVFEGKSCTCGCSCVTGDTLISLSMGLYSPISEVKKEDEVLTPLSEFGARSVDLRLTSIFQNYIKVYVTKFSNQQKIVSSDNHTFITPDQKVIQAKNLKIGMQVLGENSEIVTVTQSTEKLDYVGSLYNLIVNKTSKKAVDHVYLTNGVLSGDWLLQSTNDAVQNELDVRTADVVSIRYTN